MATKPRLVSNNAKATFETTLFATNELERLWQKGMEIADKNYDHRMMQVLAKMRDQIAKIDKASRLALEGKLPEE